MPHAIITRALQAKTDDVDEAARTIVAKINTATIDRYHSVILPEGGQFANYRKNPLVLFNHGGCGFGGSSTDALPIGRNLWIKGNTKQLIAKTQFLPEGESELADKVFRLYAAEFLNAWSISFDPLEAGRPTPEEIKKRTDLATCEVIYRVWDLLEYSAVTVPGNPEATRAATARGLALPGWGPQLVEVRAAGMSSVPGITQPAADFTQLPPLVGRSMADVQASVTRELRAALTSGRARIVRDATELARGMI